MLFFPGLRRGACQEDVEASRPPAAPRGVADRRQQLRGTGVPGPPAQSAQHPAMPPPHPTAASPDLCAHPTTTQGAPLPGAKGQALGLPGMGSLGQMWKPEQESGYSLRARPPELFLGKLTGQIFLPASYGFLPEPHSLGRLQGPHRAVSVEFPQCSPVPQTPLGIINLKRMS